MKLSSTVENYETRLQNLRQQINDMNESDKGGYVPANMSLQMSFIQEIDMNEINSMTSLVVAKTYKSIYFKGGITLIFMFIKTIVLLKYALL